MKKSPCGLYACCLSSCNYGASYGPEPDAMTRGGYEPPWGPEHRTFDYAAVAYEIQILLEGAPSYEDYRTSTYESIGVPQTVSPLLDWPLACKLFYRDYDSDGTITVEELNQNVTMTVEAGRGHCY